MRLGSAYLGRLEGHIGENHESTYLSATWSSPRNSAKHAILYSYRTVHPSGRSGRAVPVVASGEIGIWYELACECRFRFRRTRLEWLV